MNNTSEIIKALETIWKKAMRKNKDIMPCIFIYYTPTQKANQKYTTRGHYWAKTWIEKGTGEKVDELFINASLILDGEKQVLTTLLHEACHSIARKRGVQEVSRKGRYHNKEFKKLCDEMGLTTGKDKVLGITTTGMTEKVIKDYAKELEIIKNIVDVVRPPSIEAEKEGKEKSRQLKMVCKCETPRIIRASKQVGETGGITCNICKQEFTIEE